VTLLVEDRLALHELLSRYVFVIDGDRDEKTVLSLFTEDAVLEGPSGTFEGHAEILKWLGRGGRIEGYRHFASNVFVVEDGDDAELRANFITVITSLTEGNPARPGSHSTLYQAGRYHCRARKEDGVWRFSKRTAMPFDLILGDS
jgi:hypothetical protein